MILAHKNENEFIHFIRERVESLYFKIEHHYTIIIFIEMYIRGFLRNHGKNSLENIIFEGYLRF